jgi:hypothetical protein
MLGKDLGQAGDVCAGPGGLSMAYKFRDFIFIRWLLNKKI